MPEQTTKAGIGEIERLRAALQQIVDFTPDLSEFWKQQNALAAEMVTCADCAKAAEQRWPPSGMCNAHYSTQAAITKERERHERYERRWTPGEIARAALRAVEADHA